jgi:DNA-binding NarL/FixJ family response regulator
MWKRKKILIIVIMNKTILVLVVSNSDSLQNGLLALMTTIPQISSVLVAEDVDSLLRMVQNHQPAWIILDSTISIDPALIQQIKDQCPRVHLTVLTDNITQQKEAEKSAVDSILLKGFSPQKLIAILENFFNHTGKPFQAKEGASDESDCL